MTIQLTITGNHTTDLLAEIQQLSQALTLQHQSIIINDVDASNTKNNEKDLCTKTDKSNEEIIKWDEIDTTGIKWDERIHSLNKTKKSNGQWVRKRGIKDSYFNSIVSELKGEVSDVHKEVNTDQNEEEIEINYDLLREVITKKGRPEGEDNPVILCEIRKIIATVVPKGVDVTINNIPENELHTVYNKIIEL